MNKIEIHYDFSTGDELSFHEGILTEGNFSTHVLDFFCYDFLTPERDVVIVRSDGAYISAKEIYQKTYKYSDKNIRPAHNIRKLFLSGHFNWRRPEFLWNQEGYCSPSSMVITDLDKIDENGLTYNLSMKTVNLIEHTIAKTMGIRYEPAYFKVPSNIKHQLIENILSIIGITYDVKIEDNGYLCGRNIMLAPYIAQPPWDRTGALLTITTRTQQPASWSSPIHASCNIIRLRYVYELSLLPEEDIHTITIPPVLQRIQDDGLSYEVLTERHQDDPNLTTRLAVSLDDRILFYHTFS